MQTDSRKRYRAEETPGGKEFRFCAGNRHSDRIREKKDKLLFQVEERSFEASRNGRISANSNNRDK